MAFVREARVANSVTRIKYGQLTRRVIISNTRQLFFEIVVCRYTYAEKIYYDVVVFTACGLAMLNRLVSHIRLTYCSRLNY